MIATRLLTLEVIIVFFLSHTSSSSGNPLALTSSHSSLNQHSTTESSPHRFVRDSSCDQRFTASSSPQSAYFHSESSDENGCEWLINTQHDDQRVKLLFSPLLTLPEPLDSQHCYIQVYDGEDETAPLTQFCDGQAPSELVSSGKYLFIKFKLQETDIAFEATYQAFDAQEASTYEESTSEEGESSHADENTVSTDEHHTSDDNVIEGSTLEETEATSEQEEHLVSETTVPSEIVEYYEDTTTTGASSSFTSDQDEAATSEETSEATSPSDTDTEATTKEAASESESEEASKPIVSITDHSINSHDEGVESESPTEQQEPKSVTSDADDVNEVTSESDLVGETDESSVFVTSVDSEEENEASSTTESDSTSSSTQQTTSEADAEESDGTVVVHSLDINEENGVSSTTKSHATSPTLRETRTTVDNQPTAENSSDLQDERVITNESNQVEDTSTDASTVSNEFTSDSSRCECEQGFRAVCGARDECVDIDECLDGNRCVSGRQCINLIGSFICVAYEAISEESCIDDSDCRIGQSCLNVSRDLKCIQRERQRQTCSHDYFNCPAEHICEDNECVKVSCSENEEVEITSPSHGACKCKNGFKFDSNHFCIDIDECSELDDACIEGTCINTSPGYTCRCEDGFKHSDDACIDIDECSDASHNCSSNEECINEMGNYRCESVTQSMFYNENQSQSSAIVLSVNVWVTMFAIIFNRTFDLVKL